MHRILVVLFCLFLCTPTFAQTKPAGDVGDIDFQTETLPNGLRVIYAPLHTAPVVHVRVLYHVGSRDERADRQGFAHMFEHMMFRGSANVAPEEHMKLVGGVGGVSNAFTSFDQTVYWQTLPSSHLETALYLEADRMASFKVSEDIYKTERKVVAEEWRARQNRPYGNIYEELLKTIFTTHNYRWTPIGNMDHLRAAPVNELQEFFNLYYVPNNAVLVITGDIDVARAKEMVRKYFGWIPEGPKVKRAIPTEPEQTEARRLISPQRVPLPAVMIGFQLPPYNDPDNDVLDVLATILGDGSSSRLDRRLVNNDSPIAVDAYASTMMLEDGGVFTVGGTVLQGKKSADVEAALNEVIASVRDQGVTQDELDKAKAQARVALLNGRQTSESLASQLGSEALFAGDPSRVNTRLERLEKVTIADVNRVARKYLDSKRGTTLVIKPDPLATAARASSTQAAAMVDAGVTTQTAPVEPRVVTFPENYPAKAPAAKIATGRPFEKGTETEVNGVRVLVMPDPRLPLVSWGLTMRRGGHSVSPDKLGVAGLTASLVQRGTKQQTYDQFAEDLESRAIDLDVSDGGDVTRITGSSTRDQLTHAIQRTRELLLEPRFDPVDFEKLKAQTLSGLQVELESPTGVASRELMTTLYGESPLGYSATPATVGGISLDDVKAYHAITYIPQGAILVFAGDVTLESATKQAKVLLAGWDRGNNIRLAATDYAPEPTTAGKVLVVDRPDGKQATVRIGGLAYDIRTDEKYAGAVANRILSGGIDGRMMKYVRAEKGLVYTASGIFQPNRHGGEFIASADTAIETTADAIKAMYTVIERMRTENVSDTDLSDAKMRVAGGMLMQLQTIQQQAQFRVDGILNDYPIDYYDTYPQQIDKVTTDDVKGVMTKYADPKNLNIVIVAPAAAVEGQVKELGEVKIVPMPNKRPGAATQPATKEMLKPAA